MNKEDPIKFIVTGKSITLKKHNDGNSINNRTNMTKYGKTILPYKIKKFKDIKNDEKHCKQNKINLKININLVNPNYDHLEKGFCEILLTERNPLYIPCWLFLANSVEHYKSMLKEYLSNVENAPSIDYLENQKMILDDSFSLYCKENLRSDW